MVKPRDQLGCRVRMKHDTDECVAVSGVATKRVYIAAVETIDLQYDLGLCSAVAPGSIGTPRDEAPLAI